MRRPLKISRGTIDFRVQLDGDRLRDGRKQWAGHPAAGHLRAFQRVSLQRDHSHVRQSKVVVGSDSEFECHMG